MQFLPPIGLCRGSDRWPRKGNNSHKQDRDRCNLKAVSCLWGPLDEISIARFYHLVVVAALRWKIASRDTIGWFQGLRLIYHVLIGKLQAEAPMANDFRGILPLIKKLQSAGVETLQTWCPYKAILPNMERRQQWMECCRPLSKSSDYAACTLKQSFL